MAPISSPSAVCSQAKPALRASIYWRARRRWARWTPFKIHLLPDPLPRFFSCFCKHKAPSIALYGLDSGSPDNPNRLVSNALPQVGVLEDLFDPRSRGFTQVGTFVSDRDILVPALHFISTVPFAQTSTCPPAGPRGRLFARNLSVFPRSRVMPPLHVSALIGRDWSCLISNSRDRT